MPRHQLTKLVCIISWSVILYNSAGQNINSEKAIPCQFQTCPVTSNCCSKYIYTHCIPKESREPPPSCFLINEQSVKNFTGLHLLSQHINSPPRSLDPVLPCSVSASFLSVPKPLHNPPLRLSFSLFALFMTVLHYLHILCFSPCPSFAAPTIRASRRVVRVEGTLERLHFQQCLTK